MRVLFKMHVSKFYSKKRRGLKSCDVKNASHCSEQTLNVHTGCSSYCIRIQIGKKKVKTGQCTERIDVNMD